jgi:hypothetical protein
MRKKFATMLNGLKRPLEEVEEAHTLLVIELQIFRYVDFIIRW